MRTVVGALATLTACLLAGCGTATDEPTDAAPTARATTASATPSDVVTPEATESAVPPASPTRDPLADLVEGIQVEEPEVLGADVSWPQCPPGMGIPEKRSSGQPMPLDSARFVVVGLTNGPGFTPNPCLASQVDWVRQRGLMISAYAVASYPSGDQLARHGGDGPYDGTTRLGALANTGYQQARYNVASMRTAGLDTPVVWVDVEPVPKFAWSTDLSANAAVVAGAARGYQDEGYRVGVYSTPSLWAGVVGDLALGVPEWRAAGQTSREEAFARCASDWSIQGGEAVMAQWVEAGRDMNLTCPGVSHDLGVWFHRS